MERVDKFVPISRGINPHEVYADRVVIAKPGESKGDRLSRPGEVRQIRVDVGEDRAMAGRADRELDVGAAFHMNGLFPALEWLGSVGAEIFRRVGRIDDFDEEVLNVRIRGR